MNRKIYSTYLNILLVIGEKEETIQIFKVNMFCWNLWTVEIKLSSRTVFYNIFICFYYFNKEKTNL